MNSVMTVRNVIARRLLTFGMDAWVVDEHRPGHARSRRERFPVLAVPIDFVLGELKVTLDDLMSAFVD
jgi:hypothetical protein